MASPSTSLVWADGRLLDGVELPEATKVELGRLLGMSPAVYLRGTEQIDIQVEVLNRGAISLGYIEFDRVEILGALTVAVERHREDLMVASLLPSPDSHKAAPPGSNWFLNIEGFVPATASAASTVEAPRAGLSLGVSQQLRNHRSPSVNVLLLDDLELTLAEQDGCDAMLWLNSDGNVACADQSTVLISDGGVTHTPPLADGAIETGWRQKAVSSGSVVESSISLERLLRADQIWCITPWGEQVEVSQILGVDGTLSWAHD